MLVAVTESRHSGDPLAADERGRYVVLPEWLSLATAINVGLIALSIYLVSSLISVGANDIASRVALVALVAAMPLLAFLSLINELQRSRRFASNPWYLALTQAIAQGGAVFGFGAAVWHVWYPASLALVVSGLVGFVVWRAYVGRLERDNKPDRERRRKS
jgi:O-antigen/teichoic acid export membrane protein